MWKTKEAIEAMIFRLYNKSNMINDKDSRMKVNLVSGFWLFLSVTLFKFFMISVIYCSAVFPPDLALILLEYTKIMFKN
jgi:hypothetical protein